MPTGRTGSFPVLPSPVPRCHDGPRPPVSLVLRRSRRRSPPQSRRRSRRRRPPQPRALPPPSPVPPLPSPGVRRRFNTRDREALTRAGWLRTSGSPRLALRRHRPLSSAPLCAVLLCPVFCSSSPAPGPGRPPCPAPRSARLDVLGIQPLVTSGKAEWRTSLCRL